MHKSKQSFSEKVDGFWGLRSNTSPWCSPRPHWGTSVPQIPSILLLTQ